MLAKEIWNKLHKDSDPLIVSECWEEIESGYAKPQRFYHNITHITALLNQLEIYRSEIEDPILVQYAIFYHDIVYVSGRKDNEVLSAQLSEKALIKLSKEDALIQKVKEFILATANHFSVKSSNKDLLFFLDFDLSILSADLPEYKTYSENIRKEFNLVPSTLFNMGRLQFLNSLLSQQHIFFTPAFRKLESKAKANIEWEKGLLAHLG